MQKSELMAKIAEETGITKTVVNKVCETFMDKIVETLKNGEKVALKGFGTFSVKACPARPGYDMNRGKLVTIPAQNRISFKFSPAVKDAVKTVTGAPTATALTVPVPSLTPTAPRSWLPDGS